MYEPSLNIDEIRESIKTDKLKYEEEKRIREEEKEKKKQALIDDKEEAENYRKLERDELVKLINKVMERNIVDDMLDDGYIPMIYNGCHGVSDMSERVYALCYLISKEFENNDRFKHVIYGENAEKFYSDFIEAKVIMFLGDKANGEHSRPVFDFIKYDFYDYIDIREYDGKESLFFNRSRHFDSAIKTVLKDTKINNDEKIERMNRIVDTPLDFKPIVKFRDVEKRTVRDSLATFSIE